MIIHQLCIIRKHISDQRTRICHILHVSRGGCVPWVKLRLRWFVHAARRREGELIKDLLLPTLLRTWRRRTGGQLKTWETMIKANLEPLPGPWNFGLTRQSNDCEKRSNELAQDRRNSADFVNSDPSVVSPIVVSFSTQKHRKCLRSHILDLF